MGFFDRFSRKPSRPWCSAVIVAAGSSTRMGYDKIMALLGGEPVLLHSIRAFQQAECIDEIVVVTREDLIGTVASLCREKGLSKVTKVIRGGATRTESVRLGTLETARDAALIAIHDGARPLVSQDIITAAVEQAAKNGAAVPAVTVKDTVKKVRGNVVLNTLDRSELRAVQTPQVFDGDLIRAALQKAVEDGENLTDDCLAVEHLGMQVVITPGSQRNIKLTTPEDMLMAEILLDFHAPIESKQE